jgi:hypothetical protein
MTRRHPTAAFAVVAALALGTATGPATAASPGQSSVGGILPAAATAFPGVDTGWVPLPQAVHWVGTTGHDAPGALAVTAGGQGAAAASPQFAVTPGARYSASAWLRSAGTGHSVGTGLRFYDASGAPIRSAGQLGQPVTDTSGGWRRSGTVVGFAPAGAVTGAVTVVTFDGTTGLVDYVDDVTLTQTTGVATALVGPLSTVGHSVVDANGQPVHFHGVQVGGLSDRGWSATSVTDDQVAAIQSWGANFVRLPLAENLAVPGDCSYAASYLPTVDDVVDSVTSRGMLVLLDLHTNAVLPCGAFAKQKLPDGKAVRFWQIVATRYKDNPLVAFDLYNEPHDVTDAVWRDGGRVLSGGTSYSAVGMQKLYDTVRSTGATNLVVASGNGWANRYPVDGLLTGTTNLVWGLHAYTCPNKTPDRGGKCHPGPAGLTDPSGILGNFATVGQSQPVMLTEFGYPNPGISSYVANADSYVTGHDWVGWSAFVFTAGSDFTLLRADTTTWDPAQSGMAVISGMVAN